MWVMGYEGWWFETSGRHPETLTELAPQRLQEACRRFGGLNRFGKPNFRVVRAGSRYMIAGGNEITFRDRHGNYQKQCPAEVFLPRYIAGPAELYLHLLERWHEPEWYYRNGFRGLAGDVGYDTKGRARQNVEPVWAEGGYEACYWDPPQLFLLPGDVAIEGTISIQWAVEMVLRSERVARQIVLEAMQEQERKEKEKNVELGAEIYKDKGRPDLFLNPAVSFAGMNAKKEELWKKSESSVSGLGKD